MATPPGPQIEIPTEKLALLPIPEPGDMSEPQLCGRSCIFCEEPLSNDSAIDFGTRPADAHGSAAAWFPRSCRRCVNTRTYRLQLAHTADCATCKNSPAGCEKCKEMKRLMRLSRASAEPR